MNPAGFPHSGIHGSQPAFGYPWLFVDRYALHRLLVPRHPPCALSSLTIVFLNHARITFWVLYFLLSIVKTEESLSWFAILLLDTTCAVSLHFYFRFFIQFSRYTCGGQFACRSFSALQETIASSASWWWAQMDSNHRPHAYQACALTT